MHGAFQPFVPVLQQSIYSALQQTHGVTSAERRRMIEIESSQITRMLTPLSPEELVQLTCVRLLNKPNDDQNAVQRSHNFMADSTMDAARIAGVWDTAELETPADWQEWLRRMTNVMLQHSPSPMLRSCVHLTSSAHLPSMEAELFQAGFAACWAALDGNRQQELARHFVSALHSNSVPVLQSLISLEEAMTKRGLTLPRFLPRESLAFAAESCQAYAKALRYREQHFESSPNDKSVTSLIQVHH